MARYRLYVLLGESSELYESQMDKVNLVVFIIITPTFNYIHAVLKNLGDKQLAT